MADLATRLDARRRRLGMTIGQVAQRARVSIATANRVFAGSSAASIGNVQAVAETLGLRLGMRSIYRAKTLRARQAIKKANRTIGITQATSALEGQGVATKTSNKLKKQVARRLLKGKRLLWED